MRLTNKLITLLSSTSLLCISEELMTPLVLLEVIRNAKMVKDDMLPKRFLIISARKIAVVVLCLPKILRPSLKELAKLLAVYEGAKT